MISLNENGPENMLDDEVKSKLEDFQAETQIKVVIPTAIVLFVQCCIVLVVAVTTMVSTDQKLPRKLATFNAPTENKTPELYHILVPATADAYLNNRANGDNAGDPTALLLANHGNWSSKLLIGFSLPDMRTYTLKKAVLLLTPENGWDNTAPSLKISVCEGMWNEGAVTVSNKPKIGPIMGFISKGQGYEGGHVRIPLDTHAFSMKDFSGVWVEAMDQTGGHRFVSREAGKDGPQLLLTVKGLAPPPPVGGSATARMNVGKSVAGPTPSNSGQDGVQKNPAAVKGQWVQVLSEDFERPDVKGYSQGTLPEDGKWVGSSRGYGAEQRGITDKASGDFDAPDPNHQAFAFRYTNSGLGTGPGVLGRLAAGVTYRISFDVVRDGSDGGRYYSVEWVAFDNGENHAFMDNSRLGTVLASRKGDALENGAFSSVSFVFTMDPDKYPDCVGKEAGVRFIGATNSATIDNVKVEIFQSE